MGWLIDSHEDGFEPVLVEDEWYDGPRSGVAVVGRVPHYFRCVHGYGDIDDYLVWPAEERAVRWERSSGPSSSRGVISRSRRGRCAIHPGQGGVDARFDELQARLAPFRCPPAAARRMAADWCRSARDERYGVDGSDYEARWRPA